MSGIGDNSVAADQLRLFVERLERLDEEAKGIADDKRDVMSEAKSQGYDTKMINEMRKLRKMGSNDRAEFEAVRDTYKSALGLD